jgi:metal-responsive CopG/Arc/MetJ family transcriptional regulator
MAPRLRPIAVKMCRELIEAVSIYAINNGKSRSEVIREAIVEYLNARGALYKIPKPRLTEI